MKYLCKQTCWISVGSLYCQRGQYYEFNEDPGDHFDQVKEEEAPPGQKKKLFRKPHPITSPKPPEGTPTPEYIEGEAPEPEEPPAEEPEEPVPEE